MSPTIGTVEKGIHAVDSLDFTREPKHWKYCQSHRLIEVCIQQSPGHCNGAGWMYSILGSDGNICTTTCIQGVLLVQGAQSSTQCSRLLLCGHLIANVTGGWKPSQLVSKLIVCWFNRWAGGIFAHTSAWQWFEHPGRSCAAWEEGNPFQAGVGEGMSLILAAECDGLSPGWDTRDWSSCAGCSTTQLISSTLCCGFPCFWAQYTWPSALTVAVAGAGVFNKCSAGRKKAFSLQFDSSSLIYWRVRQRNWAEIHFSFLPKANNQLVTEGARCGKQHLQSHPFHTAFPPLEGAKRNRWYLVTAEPAIISPSPFAHLAPLCGPFSVKKAIFCLWYWKRGG